MSTVSKKTAEQLRAEGYAVIIMSPDDLQGADAQVVEARGVEVVTEVIEDLSPVVGRDQEEAQETMRG